MHASQTTDITRSLTGLLHRPLCWALLLSVVMNLLVLAPAIFMVQVFDRVLTSRSTETLTLLVLGVAWALLLLLALDTVRTRLQGLMGQMVGDALLPAVACARIDSVAQRHGTAPAALGDVATLRQVFATPQGLPALLDAPWLLLYVGVIAWVHPLLGATAGLGAALMLGLALLNRGLTTRRRAEQGADANQAQQWLEDTVRQAELTRALGLTGPLLARWAALNEPAAARHRSADVQAAFMGAGARALRQALQVGMLTAGAWLVLAQQASPGVMIAATVLLGRALAPVEQLVAGWPLLAQAHAAWARLSRRENTAGPAIGHGLRSPGGTGLVLPAPTGRLTAHQLHFHPAAGTAATLSDVSLALPAGASMAIIGPSGSGKSTLARLLIGVWQPSAGTIRLDGANLADWPRDTLGPHIGYLPQEPQLYAGSVAENIARLGPLDSAAVVAAAQRAGVHEMILGLPQGYETRIEAHGMQVTPGQRQRIALARALYGRPRLLVLDEPDASLDGDGEAALANTLQALRGEVTVVAVTHRQQLVQHMDQLLVLAAGRVRLHGPTAEVLAALARGGVRGGAAAAQVLPLHRGVASSPAQQGLAR